MFHCEQILRNTCPSMINAYNASRDIKSRKIVRGGEGNVIKRKRIPASGRYPPSEKLYAPRIYIYIYMRIQERPPPRYRSPRKIPNSRAPALSYGGEGAGERYCLPRRSRANYIPTYLHKRHDNCDKLDDNAISISRASWPTTRYIQLGSRLRW